MMLFKPMSKEEAKDFYDKTKAEKQRLKDSGADWMGLTFLNNVLNDLTLFTDNFTKDYKSNSK
ncbi:hypothetical protein [uncultured Clostridium sp.]|uniref:hypothetical protein n=1 Tax=uncultured Clostridium sp. TaxID=59620 RepID=UPI00260E539D|nr:hypothetical protein [uncultured Clostridium sp.]